MIVRIELVIAHSFCSNFRVPKGLYWENVVDMCRPSPVTHGCVNWGNAAHPCLLHQTHEQWACNEWI